MSKCSIFISIISSSIFGGSIWTLAESTLGVFGCVCVCRCDGGSGGGGGDGGGGRGDGGVGGGADGGGGSGDFGVGECFDGLFMGLPLEVGCLLHFPRIRDGTFLVQKYTCVAILTLLPSIPAPSPLRCRPSLNRWGFSLNAQ